MTDGAGQERPETAGEDLPRVMALTPAHVARVQHPVVDPGPDPALVYHTDEDYRALAAELMATRPAGPDTWLFAYGSLIWKPEVPHIAMRRGTAHGWHRSFCFRIIRFRATKERPGLMMSLDTGGVCEGVLFKLAPERLDAQLFALLKREISSKPSNNLARWIEVETGEGPVGALAFVMNRQSPNYVGDLPAEDVATRLVSACGHWGSCVEYLCNTVSHIEAIGIHDPYLWRLQELVAARIERMSGSGDC